MNYLFIIIVVAIVVTAFLVFAVKNAEELPEEPKTPKFQPRQLTVIGKEVYQDVKPKRKYKKRKPKQTIVKEVTPVGKPKISK
jgi:hypothetical protein